MTHDELFDICKQWIGGSIDNDELREDTGCTFTDEELEHYTFIGGDPVLAENHVAILCDAIEAKEHHLTAGGAQ